MKEQILPPMRTSHMWQGRQGRWSYDMWGCNGRPVVLLPAVLFDRALWWPLAAELRPHAAVIAVDLPGHGNSSGRPGPYAPGEVIDDLADLIYSLGIRRAPVVVGHASSAGLAALFATRYATHAVVVVDAETPPAPATAETVDRDGYLANLRLDDIPAALRPLARPSDDPDLLAAYQPCLTLGVEQAPGAVRSALAVHSSDHCARSARAGHCWQHRVYEVTGRCAPLTSVPRLARDIQALL